MSNLKCSNPNFYIDQTGRKFSKRLKEYSKTTEKVRKSNNTQYVLPKYIIDLDHNFEPLIDVKIFIFSHECFKLTLFENLDIHKAINNKSFVCINEHNFALNFTIYFFYKFCT